MVRVLVYVDKITSTSIPVEMAAEANKYENVKMILVSHFNGKSDQLDPDVEEMDIPQYRLGASSRIDIGAIRKLRQICDENSIDIIHTHPIAIGSVLHVVSLWADVKIITTEHNNHEYHKPLKKVANAITYPAVDTIVSNSDSTKESLNLWERLLAKGSQHITIYNGVNISRVNTSSKLNSDIDSLDGPIVVTVGRIVDQKNQETLLRSFVTVLENNPKATLVIVGDGPLLESHKELASELGIHGSVEFTGYLPRREDVYGILKRSTLAVFPSRYEGFCVAAVEAMASGLPVVASDIDVFHEVIDEGGRFASPDDPEEFARKILTLLENPEKRSNIGDKAVERARTKFPLERTGREYAQLYKEVADK